jgi:uncharacterized repeat protein (TIGR03803 family)
MKLPEFPRFFRGVLAVAAIIFSLTLCAVAQTETELYTFTTASDGTFPFGGLVADSAGNLYGTTVAGGNSTDTGTVYKLSPTLSGAWTKTILHSFGLPHDGTYPGTGLVMDAAGNLYGTTQFGGLTVPTTHCPAGGCGVVFKLAPTSSGPWTETILHTFAGNTDGAIENINSNLLLDSAGDIYGVASLGGNQTKCASGTAPKGCGVVFRLAPLSGGGWKYSVLRTFSGPGGMYPSGSLVPDSLGNLYGTTLFGGSGSCGGPGGCGVVFKLSPSSGTAWTETVLYNFNGPDGAYPQGSLIFDGAGNLYGVTQTTDTDPGNVFKLTPSVSGPWTETVLHVFTGHTDGAAPQGSLVLDSAGNLYGQTSQGGSSANCGIVYKLAPASTTWTESKLHTFTCGADGGSPVGGLIFDSAGNLYGTASNDNGVGSNSGVVFRITP